MNRVRRSGSGLFVLTAMLLLASARAPATASDLEQDLGRNEVRVFAGRYQIEAGRTVSDLGLATRLERLGYQRRRGGRPQRAGEYFFGFERFWIYRQGAWVGGQHHAAQLIGLRLRRSDGLILEGIDEQEQRLPSTKLWLEPELLAESFDPNRGQSTRVRLDELPEHVWQPILAAEDARFFEHSGMDARALARATLRNVQAGRVVQGGSTITQQLVKLRDLSPKRSLGRKASEALRALALEVEHDKTEILEAYLNAVYWGHLEGVQIYGLGTASLAYFSKPAQRLDVRESALLAAMIQAPNRLHPIRNPDTALPRYRWVLSRLVELDWMSSSGLETASRGLPELRPSPPPLPGATHFLDLLRSEVDSRAPQRAEEGRGAVVQSTLDPLVQEAAEEAVRRGLRRLRSSHSRLRDAPLSAALIALDTRTGDVLAYVGGDPARGSDRFDRVRRARRQPGSAVKPLALLEAFQRCGDKQPLYPARRISDRPLTLDLPSGPWSPENPDRRSRRSVSVREATIASLNVPFVRISRWCGFGPTAERLRSSGLELPEELPPSFVLGAVETTPLELARAYTVFGSLGHALRPRPYERISRPGGRTIAKLRSDSTRVVRPATAFLIRDLMEDSIQRGTAAAAALERHQAYGKTGTSSGARDAWFAGGAGSVVAVVWIGLDDNQRLGLTGTSAAAPIWKAFMQRAVPLRPPLEHSRPAKIVELWIESETGLVVSRQREGAELELFRKGDTPPKRRLLRKDEPIPPIE